MSTDRDDRWGDDLDDDRRRRPVNLDAARAKVSAPATLMMLVFYVYPLARVLWISVTEPSPGLANYAQLLSPSVLIAMSSVTAQGGTTAMRPLRM